MSNRDKDEAQDGNTRKEPSLKDALMPANPGAPGKSERSVRLPKPARKSDAGDTPSLQDALLPESHRPASPPPAAPREEASPHPEVKAAAAAPSQVRAPGNVVQVLVIAAIILGFIAIFVLGKMSATGGGGAVEQAADRAPVSEAAEEPAAAEPAEPVARNLSSYADPGPMSLAQIQEKRLIVDVHEHIASLAEAPKFLAAMDQLGIQTICLMGSSKFTLTLNESYGFTEYDANNEELIKIVEAYPGRFEAWPTVNPEDPDKLAKIQNLVSRGATGVKLYIGHGYETKARTYMFHPVAMDDPGMLPLYAWCEENFIPMVLHVNPFGEKKGFAQEFIEVLTRFPDLKVVAPHFILSSIHDPRLEELLDTFPNLYTDVSFGDSFMRARLTYISKNPKKFRAIFEKYPDRFMFAADLVMIKGRADNWAVEQLQAYLDMLTKETYTSPAIPGETLRGLKLSDDLVSRVLFRNYGAFRASRPEGTKIIRKIDWSQMNQEPVERRPGEAFPPQPKKKKAAAESN